MGTVDLPRGSRIVADKDNIVIEVYQGHRSLLLGTPTSAGDRLCAAVYRSDNPSKPTSCLKP